MHTEGANELYLPESWVPHVTIGYSLTKNQVGQVVELLLNMKLPTHGLITEMVLTDMKDSGNVQLYASRLGAYL